MDVQVRAGGARGRALAKRGIGGAVAWGGGAAIRTVTTDGGGSSCEAGEAAIGWAIGTHSGQIAQSPCEWRGPGVSGTWEGASPSLWQRMPAPGSNADNTAISCCPAPNGDGTEPAGPVNAPPATPNEN